MISPEGMPASAAPATIKIRAAVPNRCRAEERERRARAALRGRQTKARSYPVRIRHPGRSRPSRSSAAKGSPVREPRVRSFPIRRQRALHPAAAENANALLRACPSSHPPTTRADRSLHERPARRGYDNVEEIIIEA